MIIFFIYLITIHVVSGIFGRRYVASDQQMSWTNAKDYCSTEYGSTLATIITDDDFANFQEVSETAGFIKAFVGLNDLTNEGEFVWDSQTDCYLETSDCSQFWRGSEPNNSGGREHCAIYYNNTEAFNDIPCGGIRPFICDAPIATPTYTNSTTEVYISSISGGFNDHKIVCSSMICMITCDDTWEGACKRAQIDVTASKELVLECVEGSSCQEVVILPTTLSVLDVLCSGHQSCFMMFMELIVTNTVNISHLYPVDAPHSVESSAKSNITIFGIEDITEISITASAARNLQFSDIYVAGANILNIECLDNWSCYTTNVIVSNVNSIAITCKGNACTESTWDLQAEDITMIYDDGSKASDGVDFVGNIGNRLSMKTNNVTSSFKTYMMVYCADNTNVINCMQNITWYCGSVATSTLYSDECKQCVYNEDTDTLLYSYFDDSQMQSGWDVDSEICELTTAEPTTAEPTTVEPTTPEPTTAEPTTVEPTTAEPTTAEPTTAKPTTAEPTTAGPTTREPTDYYYVTKDEPSWSRGSDDNIMMYGLVCMAIALIFCGIFNIYHRSNENNTNEIVPGTKPNENKVNDNKIETQLKESIVLAVPNGDVLDGSDHDAVAYDPQNEGEGNNTFQ